tara:strand:+ start:452 stop:646 length:195 start_codon:yes stop_codon:yes gene_type:complete
MAIIRQPDSKGTAQLTGKDFEDYIKKRFPDNWQAILKKRAKQTAKEKEYDEGNNLSERVLSNAL